MRAVWGRPAACCGDGAFSTEEEALRWLEKYFAHARDSIE